MLISRSWVRGGKTRIQLGGLVFFFGFPFHFSSIWFRLQTIYRPFKCNSIVFVNRFWLSRDNWRQEMILKFKKNQIKCLGEWKKCRLQHSEDVATLTELTNYALFLIIQQIIRISMRVGKNYLNFLTKLQ